MTDSLVPSKFFQQKRLLVGGLISALIAGISFSLLFYSDQSSGSLLFFALGFTLPLLFFDVSSHVVGVIVVVFWFIVGVTVTCFTRANIKAIGLWLVVYIISFVATLVILVATVD